MITAIIQARMGSTRLPGKVLQELAGEPMIVHIIRRVQIAQRVEQVIVATTTHPKDDPLAEIAESLGAMVFRGSEEDVLDRYYQAAKAYQADVIVRVTGDCPVIDPGVIDQTIGLFLSDDYDYVSNFMQRHYPDGLDTEVFRFDALETAWYEAQLKSEREHVTPFFYKHPERFRQVGLTYPVNLSHHRWTVDEPADFAFITAVYDELYATNPLFDMFGILALLERRPELSAINQGIRSNEGYEKSLREDAGRLIGGILADIRYPVYALSNAVELLFSELPDDLRQRIEPVKAYANQLLSLIDRWTSEHHEGVNFPNKVITTMPNLVISRTEWDIFLHDAANPLTSIRGYAKLLQQMLSGEVTATPEQMQKFVRTIVENEVRLHHLVDDMRRLLSLERGTSPVRRERVQVAEVLTAVTEKLNLRLQEEHRQIHVILQIAEPVPDIIADEEKLYEGIRRLVDNALDFTEDGGLINLAAYPTLDTGMVIIHIEDTGIGIANEVAHRVYERFFRSEHEAALRIRGNGLGLSVAQAYIEAQGGTISFESEVGKGTIFHIIMPIYRPQ